MKFELVGIGGFFVIAGLVWVQGASESYDKMRTLSGPSGKLVRGKIVNALCESRDGAEQKEYRTVITYQYFVDEKEYENTVLDCVNPGPDWFSDEEYIKKIYNQYPVGKEVDVHYDSMNPRLATLQLTKISRGGHLVSTLMGLGLALAGAFLFFDGCRRPG